MPRYARRYTRQDRYRAPAPAAEDDYRTLQARAKALGIPARQSKEALQAAIAEAEK